MRYRVYQSPDGSQWIGAIGFPENMKDVAFRPRHDSVKAIAVLNVRLKNGTDAPEYRDHQPFF